MQYVSIVFAIRLILAWHPVVHNLIARWGVRRQRVDSGTDGSVNETVLKIELKLNFGKFRYVHSGVNLQFCTRASPSPIRYIVYWGEGDRVSVYRMCSVAAAAKYSHTYIHCVTAFLTYMC